MFESLICDAKASLDVAVVVRIGVADGSDVEFLILLAPSASLVLSDICSQSVNSI